MGSQLKFKMASFVFWILCVFGMTYQLVLIFKIYFEYDVSTRVDIAIPSRVSPQTVTLCTHYADVLDYDRLNRHTNRNWTFTEDLDQRHQYQNEITVEEIFHFSPENTSFVIALWLKKEKSAKWYYYNNSDLYDYVTVKRFVYLEYICYSMTPVNASSERYNELAAAPYGLGVIRQYYFSDYVKRSNFIVVVITNDDSGLYRALRTSTYRFRYYNESTKSAHYNKFIVREYSIEIIGLPHPYKSDCFDYKSVGYEDAIDCRQDCNRNQTINKFDKLPYSLIIREPQPRKIVSYLDHLNENIDKEIMEIRTNCSSTFCHKQECNFHRSITEVSVSTGTLFTLKHILSLHPSFHITTTPHLSLVEFLTYMFSVMSTWSGLSILSMNPPMIVARIITVFEKHTNRIIRRDQAAKTWSNEAERTRKIRVFQKNTRDEAARIAVIEAKLATVEQSLITMQSQISRH